MDEYFPEPDELDEWDQAIEDEYHPPQFDNDDFAN